MVVLDTLGAMSCKAKRAHLHATHCSLQIPQGRLDAEPDMHSCCAQEEEVAEHVHPAQPVVQGIQGHRCKHHRHLLSSTDAGCKPQKGTIKEEKTSDSMNVPGTALPQGRHSRMLWDMLSKLQQGVRMHVQSSLEKVLAHRQRTGPLIRCCGGETVATHAERAATGHRCTHPCHTLTLESNPVAPQHTNLNSRERNTSSQTMQGFVQSSAIAKALRSCLEEATYPLKSDIDHQGCFSAERAVSLASSDLPTL
jgi:hypothetical protein